MHCDQKARFQIGPTTQKLAENFSQSALIEIETQTPGCHRNRAFSIFAVKPLRINDMPISRLFPMTPRNSIVLCEILAMSLVSMIYPSRVFMKVIQNL